MSKVTYIIKASNDVLNEKTTALPKSGCISRTSAAVMKSFLAMVIKIAAVFSFRTSLEALMCRISSLKGVKATVAPILYQEGAFGF